ncbi:MAG: hypothetical protein DMD35_01795 [Gemmatimonadetes bacterium]|nr:MAG: hypothetical protein DMD35_01795 [Gemmatimonadota bacterium]
MDVAQAFIEKSRHYLAREYPSKIQRCLDVLPEEMLWRRDDASENSIGNLLLHLSGNVRQWIVSGVGGAPDARQRRAEFDAREGGRASELMSGLLATLHDADTVLASLDERSLGEARRIQGRDVNVLDALYHVVEHFSMHTGQIILLTKRFAPGRVQFYEDAGGLAIPRF